MKFFMNLFKKRKNINTAHEVATFNNLVAIPKREDFNDDISNIKINNFKEFLRSILMQDKTITSKLLHFIDFQKEIDMNLELLMNISFNFEKEILSDEEKRVRSLIIYAKLKLYLDKIVELEKEIKYNYIALEELKKELLKNTKIKYLINRRNTISEEENNLLGILCTLMNQKYAIYHKVEACSLEFKTINFKEGDIKSNYLESRYQKLMEYANILHIKDSYNFEDIVIKIAYLERELEIYAYNHKDDIDVMRSIIEEYYLHNYFSDNDLKEIETKYRVLDEFERDIVTMEDLYSLYKLKFDYLVKDIYTQDGSKFLGIDDERRDFIEYSIYGTIVMEMIEDLLMDKNQNLTNQFDTKKEGFWKLFKELLSTNNTKMYNSTYDVNAILTNNLVLAFLVATYHNKLLNFFNNFIIKTPNTILNLIDLEKTIPLSTFIKIYNIGDRLFYIDAEHLKYYTNLFYETEKNEKLIKYYSSLETLSNIYSMVKKESKELPEDIRLDRYRIPEGIVSLCRIQQPTLVYSEKSLVIDRLLAPGKGKHVYTPKSLKELNTSALGSITMIELILNEGLKKLLVDKRSNIIVTKGIVIPSTLEIEECNGNTENTSISLEKEEKSLFGFNRDFLDEIHFTNFRESIILNDKKNLKEIFSKIIIKEQFLKFKLERIVLWEGEYNDLKSHKYSVNRKEMQQIINYVAGKHPKVYHNALKRNYEMGTFIDLIIGKFISTIYKKSGFMLCDKKKLKNGKVKVMKKDTL